MTNEQRNRYVVAQYQLAATAINQQLTSTPETVKLVSAGNSLVEEFMKIERERNDLRDMLKGMARNINNMLKEGL